MLIYLIKFHLYIVVRKQLGRNFAKLLIENTNEMQTERKNRVRALVSANFGRNSDITAKTSAAQQQKPANKKKKLQNFLNLLSALSIRRAAAARPQFLFAPFRSLFCLKYTLVVHTYIQYTHT